jgi:K+-sensing histidine kinase KdpD
LAIPVELSEKDMTADKLRNLKHELRTPVNHILGYSSLLLEAADDASDSTLSLLANGICANAQILVRMMEKNLLSPDGQMGDSQMATLRTSVRPVVGQILDALPPESELNGLAPYAEDLKKIRSAANGLLSLLQVAPE